MNATKIIKKIFLVMLFATVAVDMMVAMQEPVGAAPAQATEPQETCTCKWTISKTSCNQKFDTKQEFYDHVKEEHFKPAQKDSDGKFHCEWQDCSHEAARKYDLHIHMRTHTKEKPFKCTFPGCSHRSATQCALQRHMRKHTGEKPFKCPEPGCSYRSAKKINVQRHKQLHADEKPFQCHHSGCDFRTAWQHGLKEHIKTHIKKHTDEKPYKCTVPGCSFRTAWKKIIPRHIKARHPKISLSKPSEIVPPNQEDTRLSLVAPTIQYICPYCSRYFDHEPLFENHLLEHYGLQ